MIDLSYNNNIECCKFVFEMILYVFLKSRFKPSDLFLVI